jgi:phosphoribosylamine--glycine ligase
MNILVVGGGGREHALIRKIKENPSVKNIYALPGNGGIAADAECVPIGAKDIPAIVEFAQTHAIDFAVVAPDDPLVLGAVDAINAIGIDCFGPTADAAVIEGSKVFSKTLMSRYGIPTAAHRVFDDAKEAKAYVETLGVPVVIKADGLALGKGVIIARTKDEAFEAIRSMMEEKIFGDSGSRVVIEEFLTGPEVSVLAFTDGQTMIPMVSSMDHKKIGDGDVGPNTGGMGAVAPNPFYTDAIAAQCMDDIFLPTMHAMNAENRTFRGCLYFGLMLTKKGPKVIEYNCRFGDPEAQVVLPLLESDLLDIMMHTARGTLADADVRFSGDSACCVILASSGYPGAYDTGFDISIPADILAGASAQVYAAGVRREGDRLLTAGGRVLGVTAVASSLPEAVEKAYEAAGRIHFENAYYRTDIGAKAVAEGGAR